MIDPKKIEGWRDLAKHFGTLTTGPMTAVEQGTLCGVVTVLLEEREELLALLREVGFHGGISEVTCGCCGAWVADKRAHFRDCRLAALLGMEVAR